MKSKIGFRLRGFCVFSILCFTTSTVGAQPDLQRDIYLEMRKQIKDELYKEIKEDLYNEFSQDIQDTIKSQVKKEVETYIADQYSSNAYFYSGQHLPVTELIETSVKNNIKKMFSSEQSEVFISDIDLDRIIAGKGIETDVPIEKGFKKSPQQFSEDGTLNIAQAMNSSDYETVGGEERQESIERTLQQKGSVLLPKGTLQIEPSSTWAHFSSNRVNIEGFSVLPVLVIGDISVQETKRDVFIQNLAFKYSPLNNLQAEVKIPFRGQYSRDTISETSETTSTSAGIGDIEFGLSRQIGWEEGLMPDLIAAINVKSTTGRSPYNRAIGLGTGHWAVRGSLIAAKASDPAVIFGSLSYSYNFEESITGLGDIKPGNSIGYSLGLAIALSYQVALNFSFDHTVSEKLKVADRNIDGSLLNSANVKIGANWAINEKSSVNFGVSFGVTDDAPDVTVEVRFPYVF